MLGGLNDELGAQYLDEALSQAAYSAGSCPYDDDDGDDGYSDCY